MNENEDESEIEIDAWNYRGSSPEKLNAEGEEIVEPDAHRPPKA